MGEQRDFRQELVGLMRRLQLTQADVVRRTGLSSGWVSQMVRNGKVPSRAVVQLMTDRLELGYDDRARLFAAAGYAADEAVTPDGLPQPVISLALELAPLSQKRLDVMRWLAQEPTRIDSIAALRDDRVMLALAAA